LSFTTKDSMPEDTERFHQLLCEQFRARDIDAFIDSSGVRLRKWPTVSIKVLHLSREGKQLLHVILLFNLSEALPKNKILCEAVGVGDDLETAMSDAAWQWAQGVAPPIISFLSRQILLGTECWPNGSDLGIDGWQTLTGPCLLRGRRELVEQAKMLVEQRPPAGFLCKEILAALYPDKAFETVSLYLGRVGDTVYSQVRIGFAPQPGIERALRDFPLPVHAASEGIVSVRQFLLCMNMRPIE
jgi:hypothetical protein